MKRSEALDLIKKQWNESTSFPSDQSVAEYILSALEKAGMQPPKRTPIIRHIWGVQKCQPENTWEEE